MVRFFFKDTKTVEEELLDRCSSLIFMVAQTTILSIMQVTGKAVMLDEIINYLQSLQSQVEAIIQVTGMVQCWWYTVGLKAGFASLPYLLNAHTLPTDW
ncbi:unnamed protein product [Urochloa humidicola]